MPNFVLPSYVTSFVQYNALRNAGNRTNFVTPTAKPSRCTCLSNYLFLHNTQHVSDGLSVHHQELKTAHRATGICQTEITETGKIEITGMGKIETTGMGKIEITGMGKIETTGMGKIEITVMGKIEITVMGKIETTGMGKDVNTSILK
jgi:hypothetical protein